MRIHAVWFVAIVVASGVAGSAARGADDLDIRDAVKRIQDSLTDAMHDLPADATTASQADARQKAAEMVREKVSKWSVHAEFIVKDVEFVRPDLTAIIVKGEDIGEHAAAENEVLAKVPVELGRSIRKGDRIRLTGPAVLRVSPLDKIRPNAASDEWTNRRTEIAFSADPRRGGGHNDQSPQAWPRWILSLSNPAVEVLGAGSGAKHAATTGQDATTQGSSQKDVQTAGANSKMRDVNEIAREIEVALTDAHSKGETTVAKRAAVEDTMRKLVADVAALESATLTARVTDVDSVKAAGEKTRCRVAIDPGPELPSGARCNSRYSVTLSTAGAATAANGPCTIRITGKPALYFPLLASGKKSRTNRPHGTVVLRSGGSGHDRWELLLTDEVDSVEKIEK